MEQFKEPAAASSQAALPPGRVPTGSGETTKGKAVARPSTKAKVAPSKVASSQIVVDDETDKSAAPPTKRRKLVPAEPAHPPKYIDKRPIDDIEEMTEDEPEQGDENHGEFDLDAGLPESWKRTLLAYEVDEHARLQLSLFAELSYEGASEIMWKLKKEREQVIGNPSAFVAKCVTQARRQYHGERYHSRW